MSLHTPRAGFRHRPVRRTALRAVDAAAPLILTSAPGALFMTVFQFATRAALEWAHAGSDLAAFAATPVWFWWAGAAATALLLAVAAVVASVGLRLYGHLATSRRFTLAGGVRVTCDPVMTGSAMRRDVDPLAAVRVSLAGRLAVCLAAVAAYYLSLLHGWRFLEVAAFFGGLMSLIDTLPIGGLAGLTATRDWWPRGALISQSSRRSRLTLACLHVLTAVCAFLYVFLALEEVLHVS